MQQRRPQETKIEDEEKESEDDFALAVTTRVHPTSGAVEPGTAVGN